jgi:hypothetical protein
MLFILLFTATLQLHAGVYKWVDENGRTHFSDRPMTGESTAITIKRKDPEQPSAGDSDRNLKMQRMLDVYEEERAEKKEAKRKQQAERKKRKQNCVRARDRYNTHLRARGIYDFNKDGKRQYLDESERTRHMKKLKSDIARWCN